MLILECGKYVEQNLELIIIKHLKKSKPNYKDQIKAYVEGIFEWVKKYPNQV